MLGPATSVGVAAGASAIIASLQAPLEADVYLVYYGMSIGTIANQNFATFNILVNGAIFRTDATQFGSLNVPTRLPVPQKLGQGVNVQIQGVMAAGAAGVTDMGAVVGLVYVAPGQVPNV